VQPALLLQEGSPHCRANPHGYFLLFLFRAASNCHLSSLQKKRKRGERTGAADAGPAEVTAETLRKRIPISARINYTSLMDQLFNVDPHSRTSIFATGAVLVSFVICFVLTQLTGAGQHKSTQPESLGSVEGEIMSAVAGDGDSLMGSLFAVIFSSLQQLGRRGAERCRRRGRR